MKRLEVSGAVRLIYRSLGVKGLRPVRFWSERKSANAKPNFIRLRG